MGDWLLACPHCNLLLPDSGATCARKTLQSTVPSPQARANSLSQNSFAFTLPRNITSDDLPRSFTGSTFRAVSASPTHGGLPCSACHACPCSSHASLVPKTNVMVSTTPASGLPCPHLIQPGRVDTLGLPCTNQQDWGLYPGHSCCVPRLRQACSCRAYILQSGSR